MTPQAAAFLGKARRLLARAETMLGVGLAEDAGRTAYLAGFNAAQALIFEHHRRVLKTHQGVQTEFHRLTKDEPRFDLDLRAFLGRTYRLKAIADYEVGPGAEVSVETAIEAIQTARRFVDAILVLLPPGDDGAPPPPPTP